jgi:hypothetical protein
VHGRIRVSMDSGIRLVCNISLYLCVSRPILNNTSTRQFFNSYATTSVKFFLFQCYDYFVSRVHANDHYYNNCGVF